MKATAHGKLSMRMTPLANTILDVLDKHIDKIEAAGLRIQKYFNEQLTELRRLERGKPEYVAVWPKIWRTGRTTNQDGKRAPNGKGGVQIVWARSWKNKRAGSKGSAVIPGSKGGQPYDMKKLVKKVPAFAQDLVKECEIPLAFLRHQAFVLGKIRADLTKKFVPASIRDEAAWMRMDNTTDEVREFAGLQ